MPTPFYHLNLAQEVMAKIRFDSNAAAIIQDNPAEFLFGNIAADVQVVSGQARAETHFFDLPLRQNILEPWLLLWQSYPQLNPPLIPNSAHKAFILGYACHLLADWEWIKQIFVPVFGLKRTWGTFQERLIWHNVLRAQLDQEVVSTLNPQIGANLAKAQPHQWLPFVQDAHLIQWRDQIVRQLLPGEKIETIEIFASRQHISAEEFKRYLSSPVEIEKTVYSRLPKIRLSLFRRELVENLLAFLDQIC
ncbi:MAG: zinc dependent phospholipase C family protein [Anaerolineales bacterium]